MSWLVKLTKHGGQYRITLPRGLVVRVGLEDVEVVSLRRFAAGGILIEEYHGKGKEGRDVPEDKA